MNATVRLGTAALVLGALILAGIAALAVACAWAAWHRVRCRVSRRRRVPGLPVDGEPLEGGDLAAFADIIVGYWRRTAREPERSP